MSEVRVIGHGSPLAGVEGAILIDAVEMGLEPRCVKHFTLGQVALADAPSLSLHQGRLAQTLLLGQEMDLMPNDLTAIGIQP